MREREQWWSSVGVVMVDDMTATSKAMNSHREEVVAVGGRQRQRLVVPMHTTQAVTAFMHGGHGSFQTRETQGRRSALPWSDLRAGTSDGVGTGTSCQPVVAWGETSRRRWYIGEGLTKPSWKIWIDKNRNKNEKIEFWLGLGLGLGLTTQI